MKKYMTNKATKCILFLVLTLIVSNGSTYGGMLRTIIDGSIKHRFGKAVADISEINEDNLPARLKQVFEDTYPGQVPEELKHRQREVLQLFYIKGVSTLKAIAKELDISSEEEVVRRRYQGVNILIEWLSSKYKIPSLKIRQTLHELRNNALLGLNYRLKIVDINENNLQQILRDVLEGTSTEAPQRLLPEQRKVLRLFYIEGLSYDDIIQRTGNTNKNTLRVQAKRGKEVLVDWLGEYGIERDKVIRGLKELRKSVKWLVEYREWMGLYNEWFNTKDPLNAQAPTAISFDFNSQKRLQLNQLFKQLHIRIPLVSAGKLIPKFDSKYGFLLEVEDASGNLLHRYLVADLSGRKMMPAPAGAVNLPSRERPGASSSLMKLVLGYGPEDLLAALKPRNIITFSIRGREGYGKQIALFPRHFHQIKLPIAYPSNLKTIIPDISLITDRKVAILLCEEGTHRPVMEVIIEKSNGRLNLYTERKGSYAEWAEEGVNRMAARAARAWLRSDYIGLPPQLGRLSVKVERRTERGKSKYVTFLIRLFLPTWYTDSSVLLCLFTSAKNERLLGIWSVDADPNTELPIRAFRLHKGNLNLVSLNEVRRHLRTLPVVATMIGL